ncbi:hypothetical protein RHSIM_Rhsim02G0052300 [Rhododendron simsii]|uniref:Uncharacterized protein n=1 Tax=Rhododendron simsii TaxID=118357 RepID=A0A834HF43_RHOSS|nr:hypothetical protein RHSIM_Rhsim02G0052300 [Rhododendron simsii]
MEAERFMVDDLLNFTLDVCGEVVDDYKNDQSTLKPPPSSSLELLDRNTQDPDELPSLSPEFGEEELEWLSNKDAFPAVETCFPCVETCMELLSGHPGSVLNHQSPVQHFSSMVLPDEKTEQAAFEAATWVFRLVESALLVVEPSEGGSYYIMFDLPDGHNQLSVLSYDRTDIHLAPTLLVLSYDRTEVNLAPIATAVLPTCGVAFASTTGCIFHVKSL